MTDSDAAKYFRNVPWAAALLDQPNIVVEVNDSREKKASNEDALFGSTLKTADTIANSLIFYKRPSESDQQIEEVSTLMSIGTGLDGWPQIMHGGITATIVDEVVGMLIVTNGAYHRRNPGRNEGPKKNMSAIAGGSFTAELKVTYKAPVRTPCVLLATAKYVKREGRKDWIYSEVIQVDESTQRQIVCSTGDVLMIARRAAL